MARRSQLLAERLEQGAGALAKLAESLSDAEWRMKIPHDGRPVGVLVHHVGNMYPIEIQLAQALGAGKPIAGVTWDAVAEINANHAKEHAEVTKQEAVEFLRRLEAREAELGAEIKRAEADLAQSGEAGRPELDTIREAARTRRARADALLRAARDGWKKDAGGLRPWR